MDIIQRKTQWQNKNWCNDEKINNNLRNSFFKKENIVCDKNKNKIAEINNDLASAENLLEINHVPSKKEMILAIAYLKNVLVAIEKKLGETQ